MSRPATTPLLPLAVLIALGVAACDNAVTNARIPIFDASASEVGTFVVPDAGVDAPAKKDAARDAKLDTTMPVDAMHADGPLHPDTGTDASHPPDALALHDALSDALHFNSHDTGAKLDGGEDAKHDAETHDAAGDGMHHDAAPDAPKDSGKPDADASKG